MSGMRSVRWAVAAAAVAMGATIALTGCSTAAPAAVESSTPSPTPTPTPSATPTPAPAVDPDDVSTWVVTGGGIGPIERGAAYPAFAAALPAFTTEEWCPGVVGLSAADSPGFQVRLTDDGASVYAVWMSPGEPGGPAPATETGVRIGTSQSELEAAYPDLAQAGQIGAETYVYAAGDDETGWIDFTVSNGAVTMIGVSDRPLAPKELCG